MPWRCPACTTPFGLDIIERAPLPGRTYRCNVCRLELVLDETTNRLVVPPLTVDEPPKKRP
jgi:hypothetical protein